MRSRLPVVLITILAVIVLAAPASAGPRSGVPKVPQGFVGMTLDGPMWPNVDPHVSFSHELDAMVASGVQTLRVPLYWSYLQPYASVAKIPSWDKRHFDLVGGVPTYFGEFDRLMIRAAQRHLTVTPVVIDAPAWDAVRVYGVKLKTPKSFTPLARFLTAMVKRYGSRGSIWASNLLPRDPVRYWVIWNEPYISGNWIHQPSWAPSFVAMMKVAHATIHRTDPSAKVILAGLASYSPTFLTQIYRVHGARASFDVVNAHPYTHTASGVITILGLLRSVMAANHDNNKPIMIGEMSWPSACKRIVRGRCSHWLTQIRYGWEVDAAGQAQRITKVMPLLAANRARLHLLFFDYYTWATYETPRYSFDYAGLFKATTAGLLAKPAFAAFKKGALALEHCRAKGPTATSCLH